MRRSPSLLGSSLKVALFCSAMSCAGSMAAQRGDNALAAGDLEDAVQAYKQALKESPDEAGYRIKLNVALRRRADLWLEQAKQLEERGKLREALARCEDILSEITEDEAALALRQQIQSEYAATEAQLQQAETELQLRNQPALVAARLKALLRFSSTFPKLPELMVRAQAIQESNQRAQLGTLYLEQRNYEPALTELQGAVRIDASNHDAELTLRKTEEVYSQAIAQDGDAAQGMLRYSVALADFDRAAALLAQRPPSEQEPALRRGQELREALAAKSVAAGRLLVSAYPATAWAYYQTAALLSPGSAAGQPNLEPLVHYGVTATVAAPPHFATRLQPAIEKLLARYGGAGRVDVVAAGSGAPAAMLRLQLVSDSIESRNGRVASRSERYVQRIDTVPNPEYLKLSARATQLRPQVRKLGRASASAQARSQALNDLREQQNQSERTAQSNKEDVERLNKELMSLSSRIEFNELKQRGAVPEARPALRSEHEQLQRDLEHTRREIRQKERTLEQANAQSADLQAKSGGSSAQSAAEEDARKLAREQESAQDELATIEQQLQTTPPMQDVKVWAEHRFSDRYVVRSGLLLGEMEFAETRGQPPLRKPLRAERSWEDYFRAEQRAPGAPDLYVAPHNPVFPSDEEIRDELVERLITAAGEQLDAPLRHHCDRFVHMARSAQGDDRLNAWALVGYCREQVGDAAAVAEASRELRRATGLIVESNSVDLAHFDGQPLTPPAAPAPNKQPGRRR